MAASGAASAAGSGSGSGSAAAAAAGATAFGAFGPPTNSDGWSAHQMAWIRHNKREAIRINEITQMQ